jgi:hypothetical protein
MLLYVRQVRKYIIWYDAMFWLVIFITVQLWLRENEQINVINY